MQLEIISNMLKKLLCSDKKYQRSTVINGPWNINDQRWSTVHDKCNLRADDN